METGTDIFLKSVQEICHGVSARDLAGFAAFLSTKDLKKKDLFLETGKVQKAIGFIATGLVRSFFVDGNGNEITVGFYSEGHYATHYPAFITQQPSRYSIQCLEPTTMVCLTFEDMQAIYQQLPVYEKYGRLIAEEILKLQQARIEGFIFQSAEERYIDFIAQHPTLFNRISVSHLCSYLGVERQSLTRIRQKLAHQ